MLDGHFIPPAIQFRFYTLFLYKHGVFYAQPQYAQKKKPFSASKYANDMLAYKKGTPYKSSHPEVFLQKGVLKICSKFTGEHPCRSMISIKLQSSSDYAQHMLNCQGFFSLSMITEFMLIILYSVILKSVILYL